MNNLIPHENPIRLDALLAAIFIVSLFVLPLIVTDPYVLGVIVTANIYAALAAGFDLLYGFAGLPVLGYGLFVGAGAYVAAVLNLYFGLPPWLTLLAGMFVGAVLGLLLGIPCLRLRGLYLALATFAVAAFFEKMVLVLYEYTGGLEGLSGLAPMFQSSAADYYTSLVLMLVCACSVLALVKSRIGSKLKAIKDDEEAAEAVGINTSRYKLVAFVVASLLAGFWGAFLGHYMMHVGPEMFGLRITLTIVMIAVVGGLGTVTGPVGASFLLIVLSEFARTGRGQIAGLYHHDHCDYALGPTRSSFVDLALPAATRGYSVASR